MQSDNITNEGIAKSPLAIHKSSNNPRSFDEKDLKSKENNEEENKNENMQQGRPMQQGMPMQQMQYQQMPMQGMPMQQMPMQQMPMQGMPMQQMPMQQMPMQGMPMQQMPMQQMPMQVRNKLFTVKIFEIVIFSSLFLLAWLLPTCYNSRYLLLYYWDSDGSFMPY